MTTEKRVKCLQLRNAVLNQVFLPLVRQLGGCVSDEIVAINLETAIHNFTLREMEFAGKLLKYDDEYATIYKNRARSMFVNLKNCPPFFDKTCRQNKGGDSCIEDMERITHQEMQPSRWEAKMDLKSKREHSKFHEEEQASTDVYPCPKCHSRRCSHFSLQIRGADEPETVFVHCLDCGKRFKC